LFVWWPAYAVGMYLRTIQRRNKDGSVARYVQLAHNVRLPGRRNPVAQVIHSFGREEELDRPALARLVRSISRFLEPSEQLQAAASEELRFLESRPFGGGYVLDALWRRLGIEAALERLARRRRVTPAVERLLFALVCNRVLAPSSKRAALEWAREDVHLPGVGELGCDPQAFYRAMDFLLDSEEEIQREVFFSVANLLNLEVDVIFFDSTSTYFEIEDEDEADEERQLQGLRRFGDSKDRRPDLPQVVVGLAITREGIPVRCWVFPGNTSDQLLVRQVKDDLRAWKLNRVLWVVDTGFASEENRRYLQRAGGHYIMGEKLRAGRANLEALARPGRYRPVRDNLEVKEVWVGSGEMRRRFVVCRNLHEAARDRARRERALARIAEELAALERKRTADDRRDAEALLIAHPSLGRYLSRRRGRLVVDQQKVRAEERVDGKFLLSSSDDSLAADEIALGYKQLIEVERDWRTLKHTLDLRPIYHRKQERIRAHVLLCFLALLLTRVIEVETTQTWPTIGRDLERMHLGEFHGSAGRVLQRTETTPGQLEILRALQVDEPPRFLAIEPAKAA
jgi:Transposase DDE domain